VKYIAIHGAREASRTFRKFERLIRTVPSAETVRLQHGFHNVSDRYKQTDTDNERETNSFPVYMEAPGFRPAPQDRDASICVSSTRMTLYNKEAPYFRPSPPTKGFNLHHPTAHVGPPLPPL